MNKHTKTGRSATLPVVGLAAFCSAFSEVGNRESCIGFSTKTLVEAPRLFVEASDGSTLCFLQIISDLTESEGLGGLTLFDGIVVCKTQKHKGKGRPGRN